MSAAATAPRTHDWIGLPFQEGRSAIVGSWQENNNCGETLTRHY